MLTSCLTDAAFAALVKHVKSDDDALTLAEAVRAALRKERDQEQQCMNILFEQLAHFRCHSLLDKTAEEVRELHRAGKSGTEPTFRKRGKDGKFVSEPSKCSRKFNKNATAMNLLNHIIECPLMPDTYKQYLRFGIGNSYEKTAPSFLISERTHSANVLDAVGRFTISIHLPPYYARILVSIFRADCPTYQEGIERVMDKFGNENAEHLLGPSYPVSPSNEAKGTSGSGMKKVKNK